MKATPIPAWLQIVLAFMVAGGVTYLVMTKRDTPLTMQRLEQIQQQQEQQQRQIEKMMPMVDSLISWKLAEDRELLRQLQTKQSEHTQIKQQYEAIPQRYRNYTSDSIYRAFSKFQ